MTHFEQFVSDFIGRLDRIDQQCGDVEKTISDLRESLVRPFAGLNTL